MNYINRPKECYTQEERIKYLEKSIRELRTEKEEIRREKGEYRHKILKLEEENKKLKDEVEQLKNQRIFNSTEYDLITLTSTTPQWELRRK